MRRLVDAIVTGVGIVLLLAMLQQGQRGGCGAAPEARKHSPGPTRGRGSAAVEYALAGLGFALLVAAITIGWQVVADADVDFDGEVRLVTLAQEPPDEVSVAVGNPSASQPYVEIRFRNPCDGRPGAGALILTGDAIMDGVDSDSAFYGMTANTVRTENVREGHGAAQIVFFRLDQPDCSAELEGIDLSPFASVAGYWRKPIVESDGPTETIKGPVLRNGDPLDVETVVAADTESQDSSNWALMGGNTFSFSADEWLDADHELIGSTGGLQGTDPLNWEARDAVRPEARWRPSGGGEKVAFGFLVLGVLAGLGSSMLVLGLYEAAKSRRPASSGP